MAFSDTEIGSVLLITVKKQEFSKPSISAIGQRQLNKPDQDTLTYMTNRKYGSIQAYF